MPIPDLKGMDQDVRVVPMLNHRPVPMLDLEVDMDQVFQTRMLPLQQMPILDLWDMDQVFQTRMLPLQQMPILDLWDMEQVFQTRMLPL